MNLLARSEPKRNPNPQLEQCCYRLLPLKLCILGNGPKWLLVTTFGIPNSGFTIEGDACPYFCYVFSLLFTTSFLFFFLSFFLSLCLFYSLFLTATVSWVVLSSFYHFLSFPFSMLLLSPFSLLSSIGSPPPPFRCLLPLFIEG